MLYITHFAVGLSIEMAQYSTLLFSSPWLYLTVFLLIAMGYGSFLYQKKYPLLRINIIFSLILIACLLGVAFFARKQF